MSQLQPVQAHERIELLDIIRGIALFGILLANMAIFSYPFIYLSIDRIEWWTDPLNTTVNWLITFLAEGKFYPMFSFLFGLGFMLFIAKAEQKGVYAPRLYRRRAFVLLAIGLIHALFIWMGDILVTYALLSLLLLVFRHRKPSTILKWALSLLIIPALLFSLLLGSVPDGAENAASDSVQYSAQLTEQALQVYGNGTYGEILSFRIFELMMMYINSIFSLPTVLGMFLLGMYVYRIDFFQQAHHYKKQLRIAWLTGLIIGLPLSLIYASKAANDALEIISMLIGGPALTIFYLVSLYYLYEKASIRKTMKIFAPAGRLGLTNYLMQSIICTTIFYSYGLGLYGQAAPWQTTLLAVGIYILQILLSHLWLKKYAFGPAEWLWRKLTYK